ncbi:MAG: glycosyltransferase [Candidatus Aminicenantes bacterium]|nr:glycosyltransferase [Candidatus Aminicenantes bacterium]
MFKRDDIKFWFSECKYQADQKKIKMNGCILSRVKIHKIVFFIDGRRLGNARLNVSRPDVYRKFPGYNERNSGWLIANDFDLQGTNHVIEVHLYLEGEKNPLAAQKRMTIEVEFVPLQTTTSKPPEIDAVQQGKGAIIPVDRTRGNLFAEITKTKSHSYLIMCRPFLPGKVEGNDEFSYYFVDEKKLDRVSIYRIVKNYSHTFIEKIIYESDISFFQSLETISIPCDNFVYSRDDGDKPVNPRVTFLVSSDTHVAFMTQIAGHFQEVQYIIPKLTCKDDRAAEALGKRNLEYIELDYKARECPGLKEFAPGFIFCGADWTSEFFAISRIAKELAIPTVTLQEGPQDWNMRNVQSINGKKVLRILNHYRNADIFFSQGAMTLNYIRPKYFAVTGNPKIAESRAYPFPDAPLVLINCNFTYITSKPPYENNRDMWLNDVVGACEEAKIHYFISQHPRDDGKLKYPHVIDSCAAVIDEQLMKASMVISRFSSIPYEALAMGREAIYYNPHREPMLTYTGDPHGAVKLASNKSELKDFLLRHKKQMTFDKEKAEEYLSRHCGPMDGQAINRVIDLFKSFPHHSLRHEQLSETVKTHIALPDKPAAFPGKKLNIGVFSRNSATDYSGGRYSSLMLAEALSYAGHKVFYVTENLPVFYPDFGSIPTHQEIEICLTTDFSDNLPPYPMDVVVLIPGLDKYRDYYLNTIAFARDNRAHLVLFNFESPNWFNELSPVQRDESLWENWQLAAKYSSAILSFTAEGSKYAAEYYRGVPAAARFEYASPSINTFTADKVLSKEIKKEKRILMMVRFFLSDHKGCFNIPDIMSESMRGYTLVLIIGAGAIPADIEKEIHRKAGQFGIYIQYKYKVSDYEKFLEIQKACLLLFPSFFEGYGYPPIEALYFNTPCIAFELPVLRETCKDGVIFVPRGDWTAFKEKIKEVLTTAKPVQTAEKVKDIAKFQAYTEKLHTLVTTLVEQELPKELPEYEYNIPVKQKAPEELNKKMDGQKRIDSGPFVKKAARFIKKNMSFRHYEKVRTFYRRLKNLK